MAKTSGSQMRDYIGRRDLLEILASTIAGSTLAPDARTPVSCGAFQGDENVGEDTRWLSRSNNWCPRSPSQPHSLVTRTHDNHWERMVLHRVGTACVKEPDRWAY